MTADEFKKWYKSWWDKLPKWIRWPINRIDDPFDWVKEWLYNEGDGRRVWKWQIYFDCIMMNRQGGCRIERIK
jgi:hypothetical protein